MQIDKIRIIGIAVIKLLTMESRRETFENLKGLTTKSPKRKKNLQTESTGIVLNTMQAWRWVEIAHAPSLSRYSPYCRTEGWPLRGILFIPCESNHH